MRSHGLHQLFTLPCMPPLPPCPEQRACPHTSDSRKRGRVTVCMESGYPVTDPTRSSPLMPTMPAKLPEQPCQKHVLQRLLQQLQHMLQLQKQQHLLQVQQEQQLQQQREVDNLTRCGFALALNLDRRRQRSTCGTATAANGCHIQAAGGGGPREDALQSAAGAAGAAAVAGPVEKSSQKVLLLQQLAVESWGEFDVERRKQLEVVDVGGSGASGEGDHEVARMQRMNRLWQMDAEWLVQQLDLRWGASGCGSGVGCETCTGAPTCQGLGQRQLQQLEGGGVQDQQQQLEGGGGQNQQQQLEGGGDQDQQQQLEGGGGQDQQQSRREGQPRLGLPCPNAAMLQAPHVHVAASDQAGPRGSEQGTPRCSAMWRCLVCSLVFSSGCSIFSSGCSTFDTVITLAMLGVSALLRAAGCCWFSVVAVAHSVVALAALLRAAGCACRVVLGSWWSWVGLPLWPTPWCSHS